MVEAMVALGALTLGYLAIIILLNQSLGLSSNVSDRNIATYLAAEGIEIVRNLSDADVRLGPPSGGFGVGFKANLGNFEISPLSILEADSPRAGFDSDADSYNPGFWLDAGASPPGNPGSQTPKPLFWAKTAEAAQLSFLKYDPVIGYNYTVGTETKFKREIITFRPTNNYIRVTSQVTWTGKNGASDSVALVDYFFNWR